MKQYLFSKTAGWITLGALLALAPQITGCDPSSKHPPPSERAQQEKAAKQATETTGAKVEKGSATPEIAPEKEASATSKETAKEEAPEQTASSNPIVKRLVIASAVEQREPLEISESKIKEPVVAFVELKHDAPNESGVVITFVHEGGKKVGFVQLNVPGESPRYRTWARTQNIDKAGTWTAIVATEDGEELARKSFTVTG